MICGGLSFSHNNNNNGRNGSCLTWLAHRAVLITGESIDAPKCRERQ